MEVSLISTPNGIDNLGGAKKYCQNFARICYSEKNFDGVLREDYNSGLVDGRLINSGHHSVFDHFNMSFYFDGLPKAMAMVFNAEPPYSTSEKSARYTEMKDIPGDQKVLYDKWKEIFAGEIEKIFPQKIQDRDTRILKLAQENARYVTSVFTPTKMGYTMSLRQMNILADEFERFGSQEGSKFNGRLFLEGMVPFLESDVVKKFRIPGLVNKSYGGLKLFGDFVETHFGESVYSDNLSMSFACLAQNHRHRTIHNHISAGHELGAPYGFFVPFLIEDNPELKNKWVANLESVALSDFPQAQLLSVAERGNREDLEMKLRERNCGQAQLEIVRVMDKLLGRYSEHVPAMASLRGATCLSYDQKCGKGGCAFGPSKAISRLV